MNVVCLVGRLIADPELRQTPQGTSVVSFAVSVNRSTKGDDGFYKSDLINCVAWRQSAEFISRYFRKGSMIGINGSIQVNQYQDRETGKNRNSFDVLVNNTYFVESRNSASNNNNANNFQRPNDNMNTPKFEQNTQPSSFSSGDFDDFTAIASDEGDLPF